MRGLWILWLLLLPLSSRATTESDRGDPVPERVYRQLREDPAIRSREEALEFLAEASPGALWKSSKLCVDRRIKDLLSQAGFESIDPPVQSKLHADMLEIRSSFWAEDLEQLSSAGEALRRLWESGNLISETGDRNDAEELQHRLLELVEEVEMAVALQSCARAGHPLGTPAYLDCLLRGGPGD